MALTGFEKSDLILRDIVQVEAGNPIRDRAGLNNANGYSPQLCSYVVVTVCVVQVSKVESDLTFTVCTSRSRNVSGLIDPSLDLSRCEKQADCRYCSDLSEHGRSPF